MKILRVVIFILYLAIFSTAFGMNEEGADNVSQGGMQLCPGVSCFHVGEEALKICELTASAFGIPDDEFSEKGYSVMVAKSTSGGGEEENGLELCRCVCN